METMKGFDIKRFMLTVKWDMMTNWKQSLRSVLGMTFGLLIMFGATMLPNRNTMSQNLFDHIIDQLAGMSVFCFFLFIIVGASLLFVNMRTKQQRTAFLMLPASAAEKFVARWLWATVGFIVMFVIALALADALRMVFCALVGPRLFGSVTAAFFRTAYDFFTIGVGTAFNLIDNETGYPWTFMAIATTSVMLMHAFYLLGGTFYRKNAWLMTTCTAFVILFLLTAIDPFSSGAACCTAKEDVVAAMRVGACVNGALTVVCYWLAFRLSRRMQVINNKWTNV